MARPKVWTYGDGDEDMLHDFYSYSGCFTFYRSSLTCYHEQSATYIGYDRAGAAFVPTVGSAPSPMVRLALSALILTSPLELTGAAWALLAMAALWRLPDWVGKWLDIRDRW